MPDISFTDFNPRSFEQFAQALASAVLGPGLLIFGDGPDGGREASYTGKVPYPTVEDAWSELTMMQAKFLQNPKHNASDPAWLVEQMRREAKIYSKGHRTIPQHYVLVTNIRLSGVEGRNRVGGQDRIRKAFEDHLRPLGVKDFDVWHEAKISTLLDLQPHRVRADEPVHCGGSGDFVGLREVEVGLAAERCGRGSEPAELHRRRRAGAAAERDGDRNRGAEGL